MTTQLKDKRKVKKIKYEKLTFNLPFDENGTLFSTVVERMINIDDEWVSSGIKTFKTSKNPYYYQDISGKDLWKETNLCSN